MATRNQKECWLFGKQESWNMFLSLAATTATNVTGTCNTDAIHFSVMSMDVR
jgi:hypothetical protein